MKKLFVLFSFLFIPIIALLFVQCSEQFVEPNDQDLTTLNKGVKGGTKDYGDLVVCSRDVNGVPFYKKIVNEQGVDEYFPLPIKFTADGIPYEINGVYQTFDLDDVGDLIPETNYVVKEADFGRLSLVRAPESVLESALDEAILGLTQTGVTAIKTDASGRLVAIIGAEDWDVTGVNFDTDPDNDVYDDKTIDSPVENMAIYKELLTNGFNDQLRFLKEDYNFSDSFVLAVGALAAGADKTGNIMVDEIAYLNNWIIQWEWVDGEDVVYNENFLKYDEKGRGYLDYGVNGANIVYDREATYKDKCVRIQTLYVDDEGLQRYKETYVSLYDGVPGLWTPPERLIDYSEGTNTNITGFANAVDDAIQVLEFIHSSDLIVYSPDFVAD